MKWSRLNLPVRPTPDMWTIDRYLPSCAAAAALLLCVAAPPLFAQTPDSTVRFDVASVRLVELSKPGDRPVIRFEAGRIDYHLIRIRALVSRAFGLQPYQYVWPAWTDNPVAAVYDIAATMPAAASKDQLQLMLRNLLADRFQLATHWETRPTKAYALEVSPRGLKLTKAANPPSDPLSGSVSGNQTAPGRYWKLFSKNPGAQDAPSGLSIAGMISAMGTVDDRILVDSTGLTDFYDVDLTVELEPLPEGQSSPSVRPTPSALFEAMEKQLGIRAVARTVPVETLVIDRLERVPTEN